MGEGDEGAEEGGSEDELEMTVVGDVVGELAPPPPLEDTGVPCTGDEGADIQSSGRQRGRAQGELDPIVFL